MKKSKGKGKIKPRMSLAILGCGKMATALFFGEKRNWSQTDFHLYNPTKAKSEFLANRLKASGHQATVWDKASDIPRCDFYLLGAKPQHLKDLKRDFSELLPGRGVGISMMAGVNVETLRKTFPSGPKWVRIMPNTPVAVGAGATAIFYSKEVSEEEKKGVEELLGPSGSLFTIDQEPLLDSMTPYSGSGPAYIFELARILEKSLNLRLKDQKLSRKIMAETLYGAAFLLKSRKENPEVLRDEVTSKGGVTQAVLDSLSEGHLEELWEQSLLKGLAKLEELGGN